MSGRSEPSFTERQRRAADDRHGTAAGAHRHSLAGELPCDACRAAKAEYDARYRAADETKRRNRMHAKAQALANRDLKRLHEAEYRVLYLAHKEALLREVTAT